MDERKETLSYFIYMWNRWGERECMNIFGQMTGQYIWNKYLDSVQTYGTNGAIAIMGAELDEDNFNKLVTRACELYCGRSNK